MKAWTFAAVFLGGSVIGYLVYSIVGFPKLAGIPQASSDISQNLSIYLSFIGVMLTAVTVVLTALAIGIGIIAAYTFSGLKTEATSVANKTARDVSEQTARIVAADALSEVRIKQMFEAYIAVNARGIDWGPDTEAEDR